MAEHATRDDSTPCDPQSSTEAPDAGLPPDYSHGRSEVRADVPHEDLVRAVGHYAEPEEGGYAHTIEAVDRSTSFLESAKKVTGVEVLPPAVAPIIELAKTPIELAKDDRTYAAAERHHDVIGMASSTLDKGSHLAGAVGATAELGSLAGGGGTALTIAGTDVGLSAVSGAAGQAGPVLAAGAMGLRAGNELAHVADDPNRAVDRDGAARFGRKDDGRPKTRMDLAVDDANAGKAAVGGGMLGEFVAINNAIVGGVGHGLAAIPDLVGPNAAALRKSERDGTEATTKRLATQIEADHPVAPASQDELAHTINRLQLEATSEREAAQLATDPTYAAYRAGAQSIATE